MTDLYREEILEHYKSPQNFGKPLVYTHSSALSNPFCGDNIDLYMTVTDEIITDCAFTGNGCAISIAGASILTEFVKNKTCESLTKMTEKDMLTLLGIEVSEIRKKCALLAYSILQNCLSENSK